MIFVFTFSLILLWSSCGGYLGYFCICVDDRGKRVTRRNCPSLDSARLLLDDEIDHCRLARECMENYCNFFPFFACNINYRISRERVLASSSWRHIFVDLLINFRVNECNAIFSSSSSLSYTLISGKAGFLALFYRSTTQLFFNSPLASCVSINGKLFFFINFFSQFFFIGIFLNIERDFLLHTSIWCRKWEKIFWKLTIQIFSTIVKTFFSFFVPKFSSIVSDCFDEGFSLILRRNHAENDGKCFFFTARS